MNGMKLLCTKESNEIESKLSPEHVTLLIFVALGIKFVIMLRFPFIEKICYYQHLWLVFANLNMMKASWAIPNKYAFCASDKVRTEYFALPKERFACTEGSCATRSKDLHY